MAERRRAGYVEAAVLRLLTGRSQPLSGLQLAELMREEGDIVPLSQIYRTLRQLTDGDTIRKVNLAGGYVIKMDIDAIDLCCRNCGRSTTISGSTSLDGLRHLASISSFKASRYVVEVYGICRDCGEAASLSSVSQKFGEIGKA